MCVFSSIFIVTIGVHEKGAVLHLETLFQMFILKRMMFVHITRSLIVSCDPIARPKYGKTSNYLLGVQNTSLMMMLIYILIAIYSLYGNNHMSQSSCQNEFWVIIGWSVASFLTLKFFTTIFGDCISQQLIIIRDVVTAVDSSFLLTLISFIFCLIRFTKYLTCLPLTGQGVPGRACVL